MVKFNRYKDGKLRALTMSYDDGKTQDIRLVEIFNKYGIKATFHINGNKLQNLSDEELKERGKIYEGHEVAAHTLTHPYLTQLDEEEIIREVETDRQNLSKLVGYEVVGMAYPGGGKNNDERVAEIIKNKTGIKYCRTITSTFGFEPQENLFRFNPTVHQYDYGRMLQLAKDFIELKTDTPKILYIWGHSYEMDIADDMWQKLEEIFKIVSGHDDIFYGTNKEILL